MDMNKADLHKKIEEQLMNILIKAIEAAKQAHETATHVENKAENKYDTLGLEAAYLAEGQSKRVAEFETNLQAFKQLKVKDFTEDMEIDIGALVCLATNEHDSKYVFFSPVAGGVELNFLDFKLMLITKASPLGKALRKSFVGDVIQIKQDHYVIDYDVKHIW